MVRFKKKKEKENEEPELVYEDVVVESIPEEYVVEDTVEEAVEKVEAFRGLMEGVSAYKHDTYVINADEIRNLNDIKAIFKALNFTITGADPETLQPINHLLKLV